MAIFTEHVARRRRHVPMVGGGFPPFPAVLAWLGLAMMLCLSGCGGCRKTPEEADQEKQQAEEKAKKQKEKEKDAFEARQPVVIPSNKEDFSGRCKPGHWVSQVWPEVKANRGDFQGELRTEIVDRNLAKVQLVAVPYEMTTERPAALAKEQPKSLEAFNWIPPKPEAYSVNFKVAAAGGGPAVLEKSMGLLPMRSYQYYFVVLSDLPAVMSISRRNSPRSTGTVPIPKPTTDRNTTKWCRCRPRGGRACRATRRTGRASPICSGTTSTRRYGMSINSGH